MKTRHLTLLNLAAIGLIVAIANASPVGTGPAMDVAPGSNVFVGTGTDGAGLKGTGAATNGNGVEGYAANGGTGAGFYGSGGSAGYGAYFEGGGTLPGMFATTLGNGYAVVASGDTTSPVRASLRVVAQDTAPSSPQTGDLWVNSTGGVPAFYDGSNWVEQVRYATATISSANITGTSSGQLGHAQGFVVLTAQGTHKAIEVLSAVVINDFATAAYTGGGNISVNYGSGGAALTGVVSYANSVGAGSDKVAVLLATTPTNNQLTENASINLVAAAAPTNPGTAAGVVRVKLAYRVHDTGL